MSEITMVCELKLSGSKPDMIYYEVWYASGFSKSYYVSDETAQPPNTVKEFIRKHPPIESDSGIMTYI